MIQLALAEWTKTWRRTITWGMLLFLLVLMLLGFIGITLLSQLQPDVHSQNAARLLSFPSDLQQIMEMIEVLAPFVMVILTATSVGSEYTQDTWKMIVPRARSRLGFVAAKWLVTLFATLIWIVIMLVSGGLTGLVGTLVVGISPVSPDAGAFHPLGPLAVLIEAAFYISLTLLATVATRSSMAGVVIGIMSWILLNTTPLISRTVALSLPGAHLQNMIAYWLLADQKQIDVLARAFGRPVSIWTSITVVFVYMAIFVAIALRLFARRDIAGE